MRDRLPFGPFSCVMMPDVDCVDASEDAIRANDERIDAPSLENLKVLALQKVCLTVAKDT